MITWPAKDPIDDLDFSWKVPIDDGDSLSSVVITRQSGTAIKGADSKTGNIAYVWISGGQADEINFFNMVATSTGGRIFREVGILPIIDRASAVLAGFRLRYPAFDSVDDGRIGYWIAQAATDVDAGWSDSLRDLGKFAWAAHKLVESGAIKSAVPAGLTSFKSGTFAATVSDKMAGLTGFEATAYGREFLAMRKRQFAGPIMAWDSPTSV
jgi:hypothetical protein